MTKRRSFLGFLAALPLLPFLPKAPVAIAAPIFIARDGPTTVFTIDDGGDDNLIFIDATHDHLGFGCVAPSCKLDVRRA